MRREYRVKVRGAGSVKLTTERLASGRWLAHSGYGDGTGDTEAAAKANALKAIRKEASATAARNAEQTAKAANRKGHDASPDQNDSWRTCRVCHQPVKPRGRFYVHDRT